MVSAESHRCELVDAVSPASAAVYAAGDARNGSSLVVSAIADALTCVAEVVEHLGL